VAAADPDAASHAITGHVPLTEIHRVAAMTDGVTCLVTSYDQLDWGPLVSFALESGPAAVIERVRAVETEDPDRKRWPRFKASDDATIAVLTP
jgi:hypothetical protein